MVSMKKLIKLGWHGTLLLVAALTLIPAVVGGFRFQDPSIGTSSFQITKVTCLIKPCTINASPIFPWQRQGTVNLADHVTAFTITRNHIVLAYADHRVVSWDADYQPVLDTSLITTSPITAIELLSEESVFTGHENGQVLEWNTDGNLVSDFRSSLQPFTSGYNSDPSGHQAPISDIALSENGSLVVLFRNGLALVSNPSREHFEVLESPANVLQSAVDNTVTSTVTANAITYHDSLLTGHSDGTVRIWARGSGPLTVLDASNYAAVTALAVALDGLVAVGYADGEVALFRPRNAALGLYRPPEMLQRLGGPEIVAIAITDKVNVLTLQADGSVRHRLTNGPAASLGKPIREWSFPERSVDDVTGLTARDDGSVIAFTEDGRVLAHVGVLTAAGWSWFALALSLLAVGYFAKAVRTAIVTDSQLAEDDGRHEASLEADRTTGAVATSRVSAEKVADTLASLLSYSGAQPPQTFCIDGPWGVGKSTLVNLAIRKLRKCNCTCVFFNAWHYEKEKHLFAALMEQIRYSWRPRGHMHVSMLADERLSVLQDMRLFWSVVIFYGTLWSIRVRRSWPSFFCFAIPLASSSMGSLLLALLSLELLFGIELAPGALVDDKLRSTGYYVMFVGLLSGSFAVFVYLWTSPWNVFRAFPVAPSTLLTVPTGKFKIVHSSDSLSFRYRFQKAFREVCEALHDRHLVIIIDDLDRCSGEQIFEMLEAISFLTSSGDCFIILAMDEERVKAALSKRFEPHAQEEVDMFAAEEYLKKIVNLTVKVPPIEPADLRTFRSE